MRKCVAFKADNRLVTELKFAPDGRMLISSGDPIARAWFAPEFPQTEITPGKITREIR